MITTITQDGVLEIRAESSIEAYALSRWFEDFNNATGKGISVDTESYRKATLGQGDVSHWGGKVDFRV